MEANFVGRACPVGHIIRFRERDPSSFTVASMVRAGLHNQRDKFQKFNLIVINWSDLVQLVECFADFHSNLGTVLEDCRYVDVYVAGSDGAVAQGLGYGQVRLKVAEELQLAVGERCAGYDHYDSDQRLHDFDYDAETIDGRDIEEPAVKQYDGADHCHRDGGDQQQVQCKATIRTESVWSYAQARLPRQILMR